MAAEPIPGAYVLDAVDAITTATRDLGEAVRLVSLTGLSMVLTNLPGLPIAVDALRDDAAARSVELVVESRAHGNGIAVRVRPA